MLASYSKTHEFPIICQMARDYLAIPAMSGSSEHAFSYAGNLITKHRTRISSENVSLYGMYYA